MRNLFMRRFKKNKIIVSEINSIEINALTRAPWPYSSLSKVMTEKIRRALAKRRAFAEMYGWRSLLKYCASCCTQRLRLRLSKPIK
jgi:hypothetical protein